MEPNIPRARKSTGGKAPRKALAYAYKDDTRSKLTEDHAGDEVHMVWCAKPWDNEEDAERLPPFPFQVYLAGSRPPVTTDPNFPTSLALFIERLGGVSDGDCKYRYDVYLKIQPNILACVAHQREEVRWRNQNGIWPRLVETWNNERGSGSHGFILVFDQDDWTTNGFQCVEFDPLWYERPEDYSFWNTNDEGDMDLVRASHEFTSKRLAGNDGLLTALWNSAGFSWTQEDLERRNGGANSPVLYPAVDPDARNDAENEEEEDQAEVGLSMPSNQMTQEAEEVGEEEGDPKIIETFRKDELWDHETLPSTFVEESYEDTLGHCTTSTWDRHCQVARPVFSITLFCASDVPQFAAKTLLRCLNKGLIQKEAWTLDVKHNIVSLDAAFEHHSLETMRRTSIQVRRRRTCLQMILHRIAGDSLPSELLEYIQDMLMPPIIPNYASLPYREFQNVFLYLDADHLDTGPVLVYSHPLLSSRRWMSRGQSTAPNKINNDSQKDTLRVVNLRFWHRLADELHILWSMCNPRSTVLDLTEMPTASIEVRVPPDFDPCVGFGQLETDVSLRLYLDNTDQSLTIQTRYPFSQDLWDEGLELFDCDSDSCIKIMKGSAEFPRLPSYFADSWARTKELGFSPPNHQYGQYFAPLSLKPGIWHDLPISWLSKWFWTPRKSRETLKAGHEYALKLKEGLTIPRWTFGTREDLKGPFDLPPIPVKMEKIARFRYKVNPETRMGS